tara:strand:+ start:136 stop:885 length:750 start_codon:yes stop_codon:yes gene_type:complete
MNILEKNLMIAFYISYYKSNLPYSIDIFNHILNYFRYFKINNIIYNSIKINYYFTPTLSKINYKVQEHIINHPLYYYDNNYIYSNEYYESIYNYDILLNNLYNIKDLFIELSFYNNNKLIYTINFNYMDIKKTNIQINFYHYNFKLNNLHRYSPYNYFINNYSGNNSDNYTNININNYNNINNNNTNININNNNNNNNNINNYNNIIDIYNENNRYILENFYENNTNNSIKYIALSLKYLLIPDIITLF